LQKLSTITHIGHEILDLATAGLMLYCARIAVAQDFSLEPF
jgi:hypothetical protein